MNKSQKFQLLWEIFGDQFRAKDFSEEKVQKDYEELLFSNNGKYWFFCNQY
jgi:hypothetical protein